MVWIILCRLEEALVGPETFLTYYNIHTLPPVQLSVLTTYFMFTTLSTVGFGDFCPRTDLERIIIVGIFIFGIRQFGFILTNFLDIILDNSLLQAELDYQDNLNYFMGLLKWFNGGKPINCEIVERIEQFFHYSWA